jgi:hypothetical protein
MREQYLIVKVRTTTYPWTISGWGPPRNLGHLEHPPTHCNQDESHYSNLEMDWT